ncbi:MAG: hypothetical protein K0S01_2964 [Herbinix sp.]|jgi:hypothetical protein|nr:hypothetical protein [Herbinix sp.]
MIDTLISTKECSGGTQYEENGRRFMGENQKVR